MDNDPYQYYPNQSGATNAGYVPPSGIYGAPQTESGVPEPSTPIPMFSRLMLPTLIPMASSPRLPSIRVILPRAVRPSRRANMVNLAISNADMNRDNINNHTGKQAMVRGNTVCKLNMAGKRLTSQLPAIRLLPGRDSP